jgi:YD repeat-containing protein
MAVPSRWIEHHRMQFYALGFAVACGAIACSGGGGSGSPNSPSGGGGSTSAPSCRTFAGISHAVQTFTQTGVTVTTDTTCSHNTGTNDVTCNSTFVDSQGGPPGTLTQTSRFASRADIVDEVSVIPPLSRSLGTTTVTTVSGFSLTTTATNSYDSQRRLTSTAIVTSPVPLSTTFTYSAWDTSGRPTAGTVAISPGPSGSVSITYNNADRTVTRNDGLNTCTQRYDPNGNIQGETCTGTSPSTTNVTVQSTVQICK